jgi:hypothetical protein
VPLKNVASKLVCGSAALVLVNTSRTVIELGLRIRGIGDLRADDIGQDIAWRKAGCRVHLIPGLQRRARTLRPRKQMCALVDRVQLRHDLAIGCLGGLRDRLHRRPGGCTVGDGDVEKTLQRVAHNAERGCRQIKLVCNQAVTDKKVLIAGSTRANRQQLTGPRAQCRIDVGLATGRHFLSRPVKPLLNIRNRFAPELSGGEGG